MPVNAEAVGKEYAPATGETSPVCLDLEAARAAGYADVVAPPMFVVVYSAPALGPAILDPDVGINFATMVHGGQEFVWGPPVVAGDEITRRPRSRRSRSAAGWASTSSR